MTGTLFNVDELAPRIDRANLSQWFTPIDLAKRVVEWCGLMRNIHRVLEPSAGMGRLVMAIRDRGPTPHITAHELDPSWADHLRNLCYPPPGFRNDDRGPYRACSPSDERPPNLAVVEGDYLAAPPPEVRYDLCIQNPPYEGGLDGKFLEKAMAESDRVVAILRLVVLAGQERYRRVWSHVGEGREWVMPGLAILSARPDFGGQDGAKADFCVVKLCRRELFNDATTSIEWW